MKKITWLLIALTINSVLAQKGYKIEGKVNLPAGSPIIITQYYSNQNIPIDTAFVQDNIFVLTDTISLEPGIYRINGVGRGFDLVIDDHQHFSVDVTPSDIVGTIRFKNSPENDLLFDYQRDLRQRYQKLSLYKQQMGISSENDPRWVAKFGEFNQEVKTKVDSILKKNPMSLTARFLKSYQEPQLPVLPVQKLSAADSLYLKEYELSHYFDNVFLNDNRMVNTPTLPKRLDTFLKTLPVLSKAQLFRTFDYIIDKTKGANDMRRYVVSIIAMRIENTPNPDFDELYLHVVEKYVEAEPENWDASTLQKVKELKGIKQAIAIGKQFENLSMTDLNGQAKTLFDNKNAYTLLIFYDPSCSHCKEAMPKIVSFLKASKLDIGVFAVSADANENSLKVFIEQFGTQSFTNVRDLANRTQWYKYGVMEYPTIYLLDSDKKMLARYLKPENMESVFQKIVK